MGTRPTASVRSPRLAFFALLCCCCLALAFGPARAAADEPPPYDPPTAWPEPAPEGKPCPEAPEPIADPPPPGEGEELAPEVDPLLRELRAQRIDAVVICEAQSSAARELQRRLWWSVAEVEPLSGLVETTNERLGTLLDSSCGSPCAVYGEGGHMNVDVSSLPESEGGGEEGVGGITEAQMVELVSSIDSGAEGSQVALYLLAGLVVALFMGSYLAKAVDRGT